MVAVDDNTWCVEAAAASPGREKGLDPAPRAAAPSGNALAVTLARARVETAPAGPAPGAER